MKQDIKISLKCYKMAYAVIFVVLLALVRGISSVGEIGVTLEMMIPPLAIVFCADTSYQEAAEGRWEIFHLYPVKKQRTVIYRRLAAEVIFLIFVAALGYGLFLVFQRPGVYEGNPWVMFGETMAAGVGILFFGCFSEWIVSRMQSLWGGIGVCVILWQVLISSFSQRLPAALQLLGYTGRGFQEENYEWIWGKITALALTGLLMIFHTKLGKRKGIR